MVTRPLVCLLGPPGLWRTQAAGFVRAHNPNVEFDVVIEPTQVDLERGLAGGAVAVWFTEGELTSDLMVLVGWLLHAAAVRPVYMGVEPSAFVPSSVVELYRRATENQPCRSLSILCHETATAALTHFNVARSGGRRARMTTPPADPPEVFVCPSGDPEEPETSDPTGSYELP